MFFQPITSCDVGGSWLVFCMQLHPVVQTFPVLSVGGLLPTLHTGRVLGLWA